MNKKSLTTRDILGYTIGSIGDSTGYNFVLSFFSFFMITVAGVSPVVAGTIISVAIVWDAITDPIIGYIVDHSKNKNGKRRPFILKSLIPIGASIILMFLNVNLPQTQKNIYYLVLVLVFWTSYTVFGAPYYSFGAVLTDIDSERVKVSAFREALGYVGIFCASSVPTFLVGWLLKKGFNDSQAWFFAAVAVSLITVGTIFAMWRCTRGKEPVEINEEAADMNVKGFFKELAGLMKIRPYLLVIACALCTNVYMTLFNSNLLYYVTFHMGLGETHASAMFTVMNIVSIAFIPFITKAVVKFSKTSVFVACTMFSGIAMVLAKFVNINSAFLSLAYVVIVGVGTCAYWICVFNFVYDVIDFDEFKHGKKRDVIIMSYYSFLLKLGGAVAAAIQGFLLQKSGFDAMLTVQPDSAKNMIHALFTIMPGIFMLFASLSIIVTPLKDKKMEALREALEKRKNGEEYSVEKFESIL